MALLPAALGFPVRAAARDSPRVVSPTVDGLEVPEACMDLMTQSHESLQRLDFEHAESLGKAAVKSYPDHPLPHLFLAGVYLYWIQELVATDKKIKKIAKRFHAEADLTIELAERQEEAYPASAYPKVYLGGIYGSRGMVNLYQSRYWTSYRDGKRAIGFLRKAVELDPDNRDVYFGLGQFEYYCGRLAGVLQFVLGLNGDEEKGIEMMERAAANGTYSKIPTKAFLCTVLTDHRQEWKRAQPYVDEMYSRFPNNYYYVRQSAKLSVGLGLDKVENRIRLEKVMAQVDRGWKVPKHARFPVDMYRFALAKQYMNEEMDKKAQEQLKKIVGAEDSTLAEEATELLREMDQALQKP